MYALAPEKIGEGSTVRHKAEDGSIWLDVEEEQEFAWLMSEIFEAIPLPLPRLPGGSGSEVLWEERSDDEDQWGMKAFTSVLSLPKPKAGGKNRGKGESVTKLEPPILRRIPRVDVKDDHPWSTTMPSSSHIPSLPTGCPPLLVAPPRPSSKEAGSDSDSADSTRKARHRPPALTLSSQKSARLPQAVAASPTRPRAQRAETKHPTTPFVKPRSAPRPNPSSEPNPAIPKLPASLPIPVERKEVSFFEPITPVESSRGRTGKWFRKVVNGVRL